MVVTPAQPKNFKISCPPKLQQTSGAELPASPLFGTDGIRGRVGELLSAPLAQQVGFWAGQILRRQHDRPGPVILGQDTRVSGDMLGMALSSGLTAAGLEVWHLGVCPTPGVAYLTQSCGAIGGAMISASHNPPEDNGIKFFGDDGTKLSGDIQRQIEAALRDARALPVHSDSCGEHHYRPELVGDYADSLYRPLLPTADLRGMRVVLDLAWGAAVHLAPRVFREMGAEVICLNDRPDGHQINVNCGSTHLQQLRQAVLEREADLGFAFDGDADRVLAVDRHGRTVDGDYILYFWGRTLRDAGQLPEDLIISTVMANLGFERAWQQLGGRMVRTPVGDQHVHGEMKRTGSMLGGEQSGHILCHHYSVTGDGLLTALHLAALVKRSQTSLDRLVDESFRTYPQLLRNVRVEDPESRRNWKDCEPLRDAIADAEADMGDRGRVLVRASGTEPLIRVMVEAATGDLVEHWCDRLVGVVERHLVA